MCHNRIQEFIIKIERTVVENNSWVIPAFIPPVLYALVNLIDKNLLSKYFKEGGVGTLILFSSLLSVLAVPLCWIIDPTVFDVGAAEILVLGCTAMLDILLLWLYLLALKEDEPSVIITYYQLVPVIGLVLGYLILKEVVSSDRLVAATIIIFGTTIISFQFEKGKQAAFRLRTALLMLGACTCWALGNVLFKDIALTSNLWRSLFWKHAILALVGVILFAMIPTYRYHFLRSLKENSTTILSLNVLNEVLYMVGSAASAFATMRAPVALVQLAITYQAFFVLGIGIVLSRFFPRLEADRLNRNHLPQKIIAIVVTGVGTYQLLVV